MKFKFSRTAFAFIVGGLSLTGCASNPSVEILSPRGQPLAEPAIVQEIAPNLTTASHLEAGDRLTAINSISVPTLGDVLSKGMTSPGPKVFTFTKASGATLQIQEQSLTDEKGHFQFSLFRPNDALITAAPFLNRPATAGVTITEFGDAIVTMARWKGLPTLIEVEVSFQANKECASCTLKSFGIIDTVHNSLLTPIPIEQAAWIEYPDAGQPSNFVSVPPPTPLGSTTASAFSGTVNGTYHGYGNTGYYNGTVSGLDSSTTTYNYDYSATNAASMYNLGVAIKNSRIEAQNAARSKFINERYGNLRVGTLAKGETITGHMFFAAPNGFDGPYAFVVLGEKNVSIVLFEASNTPHKSN